MGHQRLRALIPLVLFEDMSNRITRGDEYLSEADFGDIRTAGAQAAEQGMTAGGAVDLYLASAAHAWSSMPPRDQQDVQAAADDAGRDTCCCAVLVEGDQNAGQQLIRRSSKRKLWRVAVGRPYPGAYGVARSYEQAREAMTLAGRLHPDSDMVQTPDLLIYHVLGRDRVALVDLVQSVLTPLTHARGGAGPLVDTLEAHFDSGEVAAMTARRLTSPSARLPTAWRRSPTSPGTTRPFPPND